MARTSPPHPEHTANGARRAVSRMAGRSSRSCHRVPKSSVACPTAVLTFGRFCTPCRRSRRNCGSPTPQPQNAANQVRVRVLHRADISRCTARSPVAVKSAVLPAPCADFIGRVVAHRPRVGSAILGRAYRLAVTATAHDMTSPVDLPTDGRTVTAWLRTDLAEDSHYYEEQWATNRLSLPSTPRASVRRNTPRR
jgi:hypothetical protein